MKRIFKKVYDFFTSSFLLRYIFLLTLLISLITLFGTIDIDEFPSTQFFIKVSTVFLIPLLLNVCFIIISRINYNYKNDTSDILNILNHRIGSQISMRTLDDREYDHTHEYELVYRQDQLSFNNLDYFSFRHLKGRNVTKNISSYLIYTESSDIPIAFDEIIVLARNNTNQRKLVVECLHSTTDKRLQHTFKINFDEPINPNEKFDISFSIIIPKELKVYDSCKEIQSISLVRIKQPIDELVFNVCLNYEPRAVKVYANNLNGKLVEIGGAKFNVYTPKTYLQELYQIDWGNDTPYIIESKISKPSDDQYIIMFIK